MSDNLRKALIDRGYRLEHRALSFGTAIPVVNMLLAELGTYARAGGTLIPATTRARARPRPIRRESDQEICCGLQ